MISLFTNALKNRALTVLTISTSLLAPTTSTFACHRGGYGGYQTGVYFPSSYYGGTVGTNIYTPVVTTPITMSSGPIIQTVSMSQPVVADASVTSAPSNLTLPPLPAPGQTPGAPNLPANAPNLRANAPNPPQPGGLNQLPNGANLSPGAAEIMPLIQSLTQSLKERKFAAAIKIADQAIQKAPQNGELHQMKSLALFAQGDFKQAAAEAYVALTIGRPMDWTTLQQLYPSTEEYTQQYQFLAREAKQSKETHLHFLLGYHYLILGHINEARGELLVAKEALPQDQLIPFVLTQISPPANNTAPAQAAPANPFGAGAPNSAPNLPNGTSQFPSQPNNNLAQGSFLPPPAPLK